MTTPNFPRNKTLEALTLLSLHDKHEQGITHKSEYQACHSYRLASHINKLGDKGWHFNNKEVSVVCFYGGRVSSIKVYRLTDEHFELLKTPEGAAFIENVRDYYENAKAGWNRLEHKAKTTTTSSNNSTGAAL